eukprot:GHVP01021438.1.p1 GENE.GHVP01021438.1~~GHVP01021438.1.p1  ORF type:complete len:605 (-),score=57.42 GHVP01021438.1:237-2051(-)
MISISWFYWILCFFIFVTGNERTHSYITFERVVVWADKCGPQRNPHETYPMESLPICHLRDISKKYKPLSIGDALGGHKFTESSRIHLPFNRNVTESAICTLKPTQADLRKFAQVIAEDYWYLMYIDELPVYGYVGQISEDELGNISDIEVLTHSEFIIEFNKDRIISVDMLQGRPVTIKPGAHEFIEFTYGVSWLPTDARFETRFERYDDKDFFKSRIKWPSIINSLFVSLALCIIVVVILTRTLKNDIATYAASEIAQIESLETMDDSGWKQINGEVFRKPPYLLLLTGLLSVGLQILIVVFFVLLFALLKVEYHAFNNTAPALVIYFLSSPAAGWTGGSWTARYSANKKMTYNSSEKNKAAKQANLSKLIGVAFLHSLLLPLLASSIFLFQHIVAWYYKSTVVLSLPKITLLAGLYTMIAMPLHIIGFLLGYRRNLSKTFPCRISPRKRPIQPKSWTVVPSLLLVSGLVTFGSVFIEIFLLFRSFWSYRFHHFYGFSLAILLCFISVSACTAVTNTYILLSYEDYRWPWFSFITGVSPAIYAFVYGLGFYWKSKMTGILQFNYFMSWTLFYSISLALASGFIAFVASAIFVEVIYKRVKAE